MNWKKFGLSLVVVFILIFILDMVFYGFLVGERYTSLPCMKSEKEMSISLTILAQLIAALLFVLFYHRVLHPMGGTSFCGSGLHFGLFIGLIMAIPYILFMIGGSTYPKDLVVYEGIQWIIKYALAGLLVALLHGKRKEA